MAKLKQSKQLSSNKGQLRIIAGKWRGRKLQFPDIEQLRPTPDRVRETIFNWLQAYVGDARCLDLFAGSGALGFEALSRGAEHVTMVEVQGEAVQQLVVNRKALLAEQADVKQMTAQQYLKQCQQQFDIVFIDPPYPADLWTEIAQLLVNYKILADNALIYLECPSNKPLPTLPNNWQLIKDKKAGDVRYCLLTNEVGDSK
ncbi:MAG: 16S rRNA (guanine(966)-N(2))-methyltransferase RsmD [Gammaproteobacteria bacterium]|nr:16S rRNA (guanine(966)-N(2))-methyltransferase RsmD [Gammaproteobacteria bacterium]